MMIYLKDIAGIKRITISELKKSSNEAPIFVDMLVEITMNHSSFKDHITAELSDFEDFKRNLIVTKTAKKYTFYFQHNDEQIQIKFESLINGNIIVSGFLNDKQYLNSINFYFEMAVSQLSELITQVENVINKIKNAK